MSKRSNSALSLIAAAVMLCASSAHATCTIYADPDFKGQSGVVQPNGLLRFNPAGTHGTTLVPRKAREFRDASWFKQVSSVQVSEKCEANLWNEKGSHDRFKTTARLPAAYDNPAKGVFCECK